MKTISLYDIRLISPSIFFQKYCHTVNCHNYGTEHQSSRSYVHWLPERSRNQDPYWTIFFSSNASLLKRSNSGCFRSIIIITLCVFIIISSRSDLPYCAWLSFVYLVTLFLCNFSTVFLIESCSIILLASCS